MEVYADEFGNGIENPSYDFDKDHLEDIEVWVNGVKREDAIVDDYNNSWRMVHLYIPITVSEHTESGSTESNPTENNFTITFNTNGGNNIDN